MDGAARLTCPVRSVALLADCSLADELEESNKQQNRGRRARGVRSPRASSSYCDQSGVRSYLERPPLRRRFSRRREFGVCWGASRRHPWGRRMSRELSPRDSPSQDTRVLADMRCIGSVLRRSVRSPHRHVWFLAVYARLPKPTTNPHPPLDAPLLASTGKRPPPSPYRRIGV